MNDNVLEDGRRPDLNPLTALVGKRVVALANCSRPGVPPTELAIGVLVDFGRVRVRGAIIDGAWLELDTGARTTTVVDLPEWGMVQLACAEGEAHHFVVGERFPSWRERKCGGCGLLQRQFASAPLSNGPYSGLWVDIPALLYYVTGASSPIRKEIQ